MRTSEVWTGVKGMDIEQIEAVREAMAKVKVKKGRIVRIAVVDKGSDVRSEERVTMTEAERIWA